MTENGEISNVQKLAEQYREKLRLSKPKQPASIPDKIPTANNKGSSDYVIEE